MKVSDAMSRHVDYVYKDTLLKDVAKLIFGRGVNGVPVVDHKKKLIGFVTEKDILSKFFPSMQEYIEDPFGSSDFEGMEQKIVNLPGLTKTHLLLARMRVHIDLLRINFQIQQIGRMSTVK